MQFSFAKQTFANGLDLKKNVDPRIHISNHIGWFKGLATYTDFDVPEPDNFNHAILMNKPIECPLDFIRNQVWFKAVKQDGWWSVFYVPTGRLIEFRAWLETLHVEMYWYAPRSIDIRDRRPLLWSKKSAAELTNNELLHLQGYYENLRVKYFADKDKMFLSRVGVPRENLPTTTLE
jgi:hypothetical protein